MRVVYMDRSLTNGAHVRRTVDCWHKGRKERAVRITDGHFPLAKSLKMLPESDTTFSNANAAPWLGGGGFSNPPAALPGRPITTPPGSAERPHKYAYTTNASEFSSASLYLSAADQHATSAYHSQRQTGASSSITSILFQMQWRRRGLGSRRVSSCSTVRGTTTCYTPSSWRKTALETCGIQTLYAAAAVPSSCTPLSSGVIGRRRKHSQEEEAPAAAAAPAACWSRCSFFCSGWRSNSSRMLYIRRSMEEGTEDRRGGGSKSEKQRIRRLFVALFLCYCCCCSLSSLLLPASWAAAAAATYSCLSAQRPSWALTHAAAAATAAAAALPPYY